MNKVISVETIVHKDIDTVWEYWTNPEHITKWAFASDDWEAPYAENDLKFGGAFLTRMAAKDGTSSFDFTGVYTTVEPRETIAYTITDGRTVVITFTMINADTTKVSEDFEMEDENTREMQRDGWQAILENFKKYTETK